MSEEKLCRRCNQPVIENADRYDVFEQMHWLCFHLEFEHQADPDIACGDPSCPWWHIEVFERRLKELGVDPKQELAEAIKKRWQL
jgi:hypothetical protein